MCSCGSKKKSSAAASRWNHVAPSGKVTPYATEGEARTAVAREGGKAKPA